MDSVQAFNSSPTWTRLAKPDMMREKEERKWVQNCKKFTCFRGIKERLLRAGIFGKNRPKHLIIPDKTCGGKRRVPVLELLDKNPLYAKRQRLNSGMHEFSDASTEVSDEGSDAASGSSLSEASLPGSIPDDEEDRVLTLPTSTRNRRHSEPSLIVKSMTSMYTHSGLTPR